MDKRVIRRAPAAPVVGSGALLTSLVLVAGCGGDGGSAEAPPPVAATVAITGKAVDGALSGATACYDIDDNGACDAGEPASAATGADGLFALNVAQADAGRHRIVVQVPATAIDADTGAAVGTAYTLLAPATGVAGAQTVFVSPLTTLVQGHVDSTGAALADAATLVKTQAALAVSPLADYTAAAGAENKQAALVARLVQATTLAQADALKGVAGQTDVSGATISAADVNKQLSSAVMGALATIAGKAAEPAITGASGAALTAAIADAGKAVVAQAGLGADEAKVAIGAAKLPSDLSATPGVAGGNLAALRWTDSNNWFMRSLQSSAADATPDAAGLVRYQSVYQQSQSSGYSSAGVTRSWANTGSFARSGDVHWNGSDWVACGLGDRNAQTLRDAQGRSTYDYCNGMEKGRSERSALDLAGQPIAAVFAQKIRTVPGSASGMAFADWGPKDLAQFGSAAFPAGARLFYQTNTVTETAIAYDVQASAQVTAPNAAVAAGGDARSNPGPACANPALNGTETAVLTLEDLVARSPGKPCIFGKGTAGSNASLDPNEWWGNSTASLGVLAGGATRPAGTGNWYGTDLRLRVAFAGGGSSATTYYGCLSGTSDGSTLNCSLIGSGSYAIRTLGDARVMTFSGLPSPVQRLGFSRVFVERGGKVYFGFQNPAGATTRSLRLNLEAANAVLAALPGMPVIVPTTRYADLSAASQSALTTAKGAWLSAAADGSELTVLRIGDGGRYLMGQMGPAQNHEQSGHELGWLDYDAASQTFRALVQSNSSLARGLMLRSAAEQAGEKLAVAADRLTSSAGDVLTRLPNDPKGVVGLWALGSATDFNTQHLAFLPNGKLLLIDPLGDTSGGSCTRQRQGPAGAEYASYAFDAAGGTLSVSGKVYDTNGCAGIFDSSPGGGGSGGGTFGFTLAADGASAVIVSPDGERFTLYRIAPQ